MNAARKGKASLDKGKGGEREFAGLLSRALGHAVTRNLSQPRDGGADILEVDGWAIEVRRREKLSLAAWWEEVRARRFPLPRAPALAYRRNRRPWRVIVPLTRLIDGAPEEETATLSIGGFAALVKAGKRS